MTAKNKTTSTTHYCAVALDVMGGDFGPNPNLQAAAQALQNLPQLFLYLVGDETFIKQAVQRTSLENYSDRYAIVHASEAVAMDEEPLQALRHKKDSSIRVMANTVAEGKAAACVSSGNTGALVAITKYVLKTLKGVSRPGLMALVPTAQDKDAWMIDLGANLSLEADQYVQFAIMAATVAQQARHIDKPKVGLLNVGSEAMKGSPIIKAADAALREAEPKANFDYYGYIEGGDIYSGKIDIILCDGFVGNVALKVAEGTSRLITQFTREKFMKTAWRKFIGLCAKPIFSDVKKYLDPSTRNGANLLGLKGIVIKSHGGADVVGVTAAITRAYEQGRVQLTHEIQAALNTVYEEKNS